MKNLVVFLISINMVLGAPLLDEIKDHFDLQIESLKQNYDRELEMQRKELLTTLTKETKNICLDGVDKDSILSGKEYLKKFAEGPCSPTIMLPGIGGSKLVAEIDCPTLKKESSEIFQACKWTECLKEGEVRTGKHIPKSEYTVWVPGLTSPFSLTQDGKLRRDCFNGLMGLKIQFINIIPVFL